MMIIFNPNLLRSDFSRGLTDVYFLLQNKPSSGKFFGAANFLKRCMTPAKRHWENVTVSISSLKDLSHGLDGDEIIQRLMAVR